MITIHSFNEHNTYCASNKQTELPLKWQTKAAYRNQKRSLTVAYESFLSRWMTFLPNTSNSPCVCGSWVICNLYSSQAHWLIATRHFSAFLEIGNLLTWRLLPESRSTRFLQFACMEFRKPALEEISQETVLCFHLFKGHRWSLVHRTITKSKEICAVRDATSNVKPVLVKFFIEAQLCNRDTRQESPTRWH